jgi:hypothetical protein
MGEISKSITGQEILNTELSNISIGKEGKIEFTFDLLFGSQNFK